MKPERPQKVLIMAVCQYREHSQPCSFTIHANIFLQSVPPKLTFTFKVSDQNFESVSLFDHLSLDAICNAVLPVPVPRVHPSVTCACVSDTSCTYTSARCTSPPLSQSVRPSVRATARSDVLTWPLAQLCEFLGLERRTSYEHGPSPFGCWEPFETRTSWRSPAVTSTHYVQLRLLISFTGTNGGLLKFGNTDLNRSNMLIRNIISNYSSGYYKHGVARVCDQ